MCVRRRAVESCPVLCESVCVCVPFLTQFSAYHFRSSHKNIGLQVLMDVRAFHMFSVYKKCPESYESGPKPARNHYMWRKLTS